MAIFKIKIIKAARVKCGDEVLNPKSALFSNEISFFKVFRVTPLLTEEKILLITNKENVYTFNKSQQVIVKK